MEFLVSSLTAKKLRCGLEVIGLQQEIPHQDIELAPGNSETALSFKLDLPKQQLLANSSIRLKAWAQTLDKKMQPTGEKISLGYQRIEYPHIRPTALLQAAEMKLSIVQVETSKSARIAFISGIGDFMPNALLDLGHQVQVIANDKLADTSLEQFNLIILGVRAYKVRTDLARSQARLMEWVKAGGTLIVQYNKYEFNRDASPAQLSDFVPYPGAKVCSDRITVEEAKVKVLIPDHPILTIPNQLGEADWTGWVQERGLYFLQTPKQNYNCLIEMEDPWPFNSGPKNGGLVHANYGKGNWVYVGLGLFRQLPAGVPGAYRLLANLIALAEKKLPATEND